MNIRPDGNTRSTLTWTDGSLLKKDKEFSSSHAEAGSISALRSRASEPPTQDPITPQYSLDSSEAPHYDNLRSVSAESVKHKAAARLAAIVRAFPMHPQVDSPITSPSDTQAWIAVGLPEGRK